MEALKLKSLLIIVLFAFASTMSTGQYIPVVEEGKHWIYLDNIIHIDALVPIGGHVITFKGDTVVNNVAYKKVFWERLQGHYTYEFVPDYPYQTEDSHLFGFILTPITISLCG